jgi:bifunctional NMN adenylyltransferase/nudix hydrolase
MEKKKFKFAVFIAAFSPFHLGHRAVLKRGLEIAEKVIVVIGSSSSARNIRLPFNAQERQEMIESSFSKEEKERFIFLKMKDHFYVPNLWISILQQKLSEITDDADELTILLSFKGDKSDYLKSFPQFATEEVEYDANRHFSDDLRNRFFTFDNSVLRFVPEPVGKFLLDFQKGPFFPDLKEEHTYIKNERAKWDGSPYPPIFSTVDAVVVRSSHVLLIIRGGNPGKGLLALPGGFIGEDETLEESILRELKEETKISTSLADLKRSIKSIRQFDQPKRSARGRTLTTCHLFDLGVGPLPKIKGGDDAKSAHWIPINEILTQEERFFEDHFHILNAMVFKI